MTMLPLSLLLLAPLAEPASAAKVFATPKTEKILSVLKEANDLDVPISGLIQKALALCDASPELDELDQYWMGIKVKDSKLPEYAPRAERFVGQSAQSLLLASNQHLVYHAGVSAAMLAAMWEQDKNRTWRDERVSKDDLRRWRQNTLNFVCLYKEGDWKAASEEGFSVQSLPLLTARASLRANNFFREPEPRLVPTPSYAAALYRSCQPGFPENLKAITFAEAERVFAVLATVKPRFNSQEPELARLAAMAPVFYFWQKNPEVKERAAALIRKLTPPGQDRPCVRVHVEGTSVFSHAGLPVAERDALLDGVEAFCNQELPGIFTKAELEALAAPIIYQKDAKAFVPEAGPEKLVGGSDYSRFIGIERGQDIARVRIHLGGGDGRSYFGGSLYLYYNDAAIVQSITVYSEEVRKELKIYDDELRFIGMKKKDIVAELGAPSSGDLDSNGKLAYEFSSAKAAGTVVFFCTKKSKPCTGMELTWR